MPHFVLAFDHRASLLRSLFGVEGDPPARVVGQVREAKRAVWDGLRSAIREGAVSPGEAGALVDATYGADVLRDARAEHVPTAMPVEVSGVTPLTFEPGWQERLDVFDPHWAKVLVRYDPDGDEAVNGAQRAALRELSSRCSTTGRPFMLELLIPTEASRDIDPDRFDHEVRPDLMVRAISRLRDAGIQPSIWKIEGLDHREDCVRVAEAAGAPCVVLGRGADRSAVDRWLAAAAGVTGYAGFAIGRSIWWEPIAALAARGWVDPAAASAAIATEYARYVEVYRRASVVPRT